MELILRCALPDRPGELARVAGAIGEVGGDIQAVDVVEVEGARVLDDIVVVLAEEGSPQRLIGAMETLDGVELVHVGPSRGHPGDAVARLALGLQSLLNGALPPEQGVVTLLGGLLRASEVTLHEGDPPRTTDARVLALPFGGGHVRLRREYRFTRTERERALAILRVCEEVAGAGQNPDSGQAHASEADSSRRLG